MSSTLLNIGIPCMTLAVLLGLSALPWLIFVLDVPAKKAGGFALRTLGLSALVGAGFAFILHNNRDTTTYIAAGRILTSLVHLQLGADFFLLVFWVLLKMGSKGGAVALAAFQEGIRQPLFWLVVVFLVPAMLVSVFLPYFTFGEDQKMVKDLCFLFAMLGPVLFCVLTACMSVHDEIEGRTAVTVMSKPISRRSFLVGKFSGLALAGLFMTHILGWFVVWIVLYKSVYDPPITSEPIPDPYWVTSNTNYYFGDTNATEFYRGILFWIHDATDAFPHLLIGFGQVMVLTALAVALATRVPMIVNVVTCLAVYLLGHLTSIMTEVSRTQFTLVHFVAQVFENVLPGLDLFDVGSAIIRDLPLDPVGYNWYSVNVFVYSCIYTAIAMVLGLILFEDRDVA